jgi:hypothetical protein
MERPGFIRVPFGQGTVMLRHGDGGDYWGGLASRGTVRVRQTGQVEPGAHAYANLRASCQPGACFPTRCRQLTAEPISLSLDRLLRPPSRSLTLTDTQQLGNFFLFEHQSSSVFVKPSIQAGFILPF